MGASTVDDATFLSTFVLDPGHEAHEPPEARGLARDGVRLLVSTGGEPPLHARFSELDRFLEPADLVVVNTSATIAGELDGTLADRTPVVVHVSTELPGGLWLVEIRRPVNGGTSAPLDLRGELPEAVRTGVAAGPIRLFPVGSAQLLAPFGGSRRLWVATFTVQGSVAEHLARYGRPIRYRHVPRPWPLSSYQTVFADEPGSVEMPSAARPFTSELVTRLVRRGVVLAPLVLHAGVSSLEGDEAPYPERYRVPPGTAGLVNATRRNGGRVLAVGTTVVRALETVTDSLGRTHPGEGWTELVVGPDRPVRAVDGLLTGWHEPEASHMLMLEAIAGRPVLDLAYREAFEAGYLWHEFGDSHLLLPYARSS
jgi:S-adenosylmethionine:tRNA ribosyltransferase-isomerase